jgi:hypothetical protein
MASISITLNGVIIPKGRSADDTPIPAVFVGEAYLTGVGVGGGPVFPPPSQPGGPPGAPIHPIWGPPGIELPPGPGFPPVAGHPLPTPPLPPGVTPPAPGEPPVVVPGNWPVQPIIPPPYVVINYPGVGPLAVAPPAPATA